jgi:NAD(P)-dependent dehydrogenase (short-subunit alcohol dehydrogenase family)
MPLNKGLLLGKYVVVLGASRGVGREIVRRAAAEGAKVLAVARRAPGLAEVAKTTQGVDTLALDAASEDAPRKVFRKTRPDLLVICGGPTPPVRPITRAHLGRVRRELGGRRQDGLRVLPRGAADTAGAWVRRCDHL